MQVLFIHKPIAKNVENTVKDCINAFPKHSKLCIELMPFDEFNQNHINLENYDCLCLYKFHFTKENSLPLSKKVEIKNFTGIKAVFLEEEYFILHERIQNIIFMGIKLVFTALPEKAIKKIYGSYKNNFKIIKVFHGYIDDRYHSLELIDYEKREIDLSYRALDLPYFYGCLGMEKTQIAIQSSQKFKKHDLKLDISNKYSDRLWGDQWVELLRNSKAVLGVECGSGVVDFGASIFHEAIEYQRTHPNASFQEVEGLFFKGIDGQYDISGISPRIFEYASLKNLMILFEGDYEHIMVPNHHYLSLKKDFSNVKEIVEVIKNTKKAKLMIDNAYNDIALNNIYHFYNHVELFDKTIINFQKEILSSKKLLEGSSSHAHDFNDETRLPNSIARKAKKIIKNKISKNSFIYTYLGALLRKYKKFHDFVKFYIEVVKKNKSIFLFSRLLLKYENISSLSLLAKHIQKREELFNNKFFKNKNVW